LIKIIFKTLIYNYNKKTQVNKCQELHTDSNSISALNTTAINEPSKLHSKSPRKTIGSVSNAIDVVCANNNEIVIINDIHFILVQR
jgi:hypothetical protein